MQLAFPFIATASRNPCNLSFSWDGHLLADLEQPGVYEAFRSVILHENGGCWERTNALPEFHRESIAAGRRAGTGPYD